MSLPTLPRDITPARTALHRVAAHVLARRRHDLVGRFGLTVAPGGLGTPAAGDEHEVVRTAGRWLHHDRSGRPTRTASLDLADASLADAAAFIGVTLDETWSVGGETVPIGDPHAPLRVNDGQARGLGAWMAWVWNVLDDLVVTVGPGAEPSTTQLWPEHFDAACEVTTRPGVRTVVGGSPGDGYHERPYLYVSLGGQAAPAGDPYWNAPFGSLLSVEQLQGQPHPEADAVAFLVRGVEGLRAG